MNRQVRFAFASVLALLIFNCVAFVNAQTAAPFAFHAGQTMYIVAFHRYHTQVVLDPLKGTVATSENINLELGAEREVRKKIEEWGFFKISERLSSADFIFLVSLDDNAMEGLAVPVAAYNQHFKEKFDLDALRDAAWGRYLAGPLKIPTEGRLSDRLVKDFRSKLPAVSKAK